MLSQPLNQIATTPGYHAPPRHMCFSSFLFLSKKKSVLYLLLRCMEHAPQDICFIVIVCMRGAGLFSDGMCCFVRANPCLNRRHVKFHSAMGPSVSDGSPWIPKSDARGMSLHIHTLTGVPRSSNPHR